MSQFTYLRDAVPITETIRLEVQFSDVAGNFRYLDTGPTIEIIDAADTIVVPATSTGIASRGPGLYSYDFTVPVGFVSGIWEDHWSGSLDGYSFMNSHFNFVVSSVGHVEAVGTVAPEIVAIGDPASYDFSQDEIKGINILLAQLNIRLKNIAFKPDGTRCDVFSTQELVGFLYMSLSEFNAYPTITTYTFADHLIQTLFSDLIIEGATLMALSIQAILHAGFENQISDNGVLFVPGPISSTMNTVIASRQSLYLEKLKNAKRNLRPGIRGMGAGRILVNNPTVQRLRHLRERSII